VCDNNHLFRWAHAKKRKKSSAHSSQQQQHSTIGSSLAPVSTGGIVDFNTANAYVVRLSALMNLQCSWQAVNDSSLQGQLAMLTRMPSLQLSCSAFQPTAQRSHQYRLRILCDQLPIFRMAARFLLLGPQLVIPVTYDIYKDWI
jgi:hypothetical protein